MGKANEARRAEILDATCRVIARVGIKGLYIRHVAEEAGVSRALVSYYFPTRSQLLAAALEHAELRAIGEIARRASGGSAVDRLTRALALEFDDAPAVKENWVIWSALSEAALFDPSLQPTLRTWERTWVDAVAALIHEGQRGGTIPRSVNVRNAAERLTALVNGLGERRLQGGLSRTRARELVREAVRMELGLASDPT